MRNFGALTNKPYAFTHRAWELTTFRYLDFFDTLGQTIFGEVRGSELMRFVPGRGLLNFYSGWITDKTRFFFDCLRYQTLTTPLLLSSQKPFKLDWKKALQFGFYSVRLAFARSSLCSFYTLSPWQIRVFYPEFLDLQTAFTLQKFVNESGSYFVPQVSESYKGDRLDFLLPSFLKQKRIYETVKDIIISNVDLRFEVPRLFLLVRWLKKTKKSRVFLIGSRYLPLHGDNFFHIGSTLMDFVRVIEGRHHINVMFLKDFRDCITNLLFFKGAGLKKNMLTSLEKFCKLFNFTPVDVVASYQEISRQFVSFSNSTYLDPFLKKRALMEYKVLNLGMPVSTLSENCLKNSVTLSCSDMQNQVNFKTSQLVYPLNSEFEDSLMFLDSWGSVRKVGAFPVKEIQNGSFKSFRDFFVLMTLVLRSEPLFKRKKVSFLLKRIEKSNFDVYESFGPNSLESSFLKASVFKVPNVGLGSFVSNYYKSDSLSKASKLLNIGSNVLYKHMHNYV